MWGAGILTPGKAGHVLGVFFYNEPCGSGSTKEGNSMLVLVPTQHSVSQVSTVSTLWMESRDRDLTISSCYFMNVALSRSPTIAVYKTACVCALLTPFV